MYGERVGLTAKEWRTLTNELDDPENKKLYDKGRGKIDGKVTFPMNISIAEPSKIGGN